MLINVKQNFLFENHIINCKSVSIKFQNTGHRETTQTQGLYDKVLVYIQTIFYYDLMNNMERTMLSECKILQTPINDKDISYLLFHTAVVHPSSEH